MRTAPALLPLLSLLNVAVATAEPPRLAGPVPVNRTPGVIDTPANDRLWEKGCLIRHACRRVARNIPPCPAGITALTVQEVQALPGDGRMVSVRGPLNYGQFATTAMACLVNRLPKREPRVCCNHTWGQILIGEGPSDELAIFLRGVGCSGDESRLCCDLVVRGQQVVVTGELHENHDAFGKPSRYSLGEGAKVCELGGVSADP